MKIEIGTEIGADRDRETDDIVMTTVGTMTDRGIADLVSFSKEEAHIPARAPLLEEAKRRGGLRLRVVLTLSMISSTIQINQRQMKLEET